MSFGLNRVELIGRLGADVTVNHLASGGRVVNRAAVIARLDKARAKYADLILVHGGGLGVERIAVQWADRNGVHQIVCKPDWDRHGRVPNYKINRIDELLPWNTEPAANPEADV